MEMASLVKTSAIVQTSIPDPNTMLINIGSKTSSTIEDKTINKG